MAAINPNSARQTILKLEVGESVHFEPKASAGVRSTCAALSFSHDRKYSTKINREEGVITVTRTA